VFGSFFSILPNIFFLHKIYFIYVLHVYLNCMVLLAKLLLIAKLQEEGRNVGLVGAISSPGDVVDEVLPEPLDMAFPKGGLRKQITYLILFPIIFPLWLTLPDSRRPSCKCCFNMTPLTNFYFFSHLTLHRRPSFAKQTNPSNLYVSSL